VLALDCCLGRQHFGVSGMLRMHCLQQWYGLADDPTKAMFERINAHLAE
jgi:hypothetical protein